MESILGDSVSEKLLFAGAAEVALQIGDNPSNNGISTARKIILAVILIKRSWEFVERLSLPAC
jgi:hypothetical protein